MKVIKNGFESKRLGIELDVYIINGKRMVQNQRG